MYAHELELLYFTGRSAYPPADPTVGGGAMSCLSFLYPKKPLHLGGQVHALPACPACPACPAGWLHTPGHTFGHVYFFREDDRLLVVWQLRFELLL